MTATITALELLSSFPSVEEMPQRIESLNLAAHDLDLQIADLRDEIGQHEEEATAQAAEESNSDKRKAKRAEILREDVEYYNLKEALRDLEGQRIRLVERSARLRREHRMYIAASMERSSF